VIEIKIDAAVAMAGDVFDVAALRGV